MKFSSSGFPSFLRTFLTVGSRRGKLWGCSFVLSLTAFCAASENKPLSAPVVELGAADDVWPDPAAWAAATELGPFLALGQRSGVVTRSQTSVRLLQSGRFLFIQFALANPQKTAWKNEGKDRDDSVYAGDSVECHIETADGARLQYIVNADGVAYDSRNQDRSWNGEIASRFEAGDGRDILMVRLAKKDFLTGGSQTVKVNFGVVLWRTGRVEAQTFVPMEATLLESKTLVPLDFSLHQPTQRSFAAASFDASDESISRLAKENAIRFPDGDIQVQETAYLSERHQLIAQTSGSFSVECDLSGSYPGEKEMTLNLEWRSDRPVTMEGALKDRRGRLISALEKQSLKPGSQQAGKFAWPLPHPIEQPATLVLRFTTTSPDFALRKIRFLPRNGEVQERQIEDNQASFRKSGNSSMEWPEEPGAGGELPPKRVFFCVPSGDMDIERISRRFQLDPIVAYERKGVLFRRSDSDGSIGALLEEKKLDAVVAVTGEPEQELEQTLNAAIDAGVPVLVITQHAAAWKKILTRSLGGEVTETDLKPAYSSLFPLEQFPRISQSGLGLGEPMFASLQILASPSGRAILIGCGGPDKPRGLLPPVSPLAPAYPDWQSDFFAFLSRLIRLELPAGASQPMHFSAMDSGPTVRLSAPLPPGSRLEVQFWALPDSDLSYPKPLSMGQASVEISGPSTPIPWPNSLQDFTGKKMARVRLLEESAKLADWGTLVQSADGPLALSFPAPSTSQPGKVTLPLRIVDPGLAGPFQMKALCHDANNRLVDVLEKTVTLEDGMPADLTLTFQTARTTTPGMTATITLWSQSRLLVVAERRLHASEKPILNQDDFHLGVQGDFFLRTYADRDYINWFQKLGIRSIMDGADFYLSEETNMPWVKVGLAREIFTDHFSGAHERKFCLSDPVVVQNAADQAVAAYQQATRFRPLFHTFGDELELARDGAYEVDFGSKSIAAFREWLKKSYGSLDRLNKAWRSNYRAWDEITPQREDEARKADQAALWINFRRFMEDQWFGAYEQIRDAIKARDPKAKLGFTNPFYLNPFSGENHYRSAQAEDVLAKYFRPDLIKQYRSFGAGKPMQTWFGYYEDSDVCRFYPLWFAFHGGKSVHFWSGLTTYSNYDLLDASGRETARSRAFLESGQALDRGAGLLLSAYPPVPPSVGILTSQESMRASYFYSTMTAQSAPWSRYGLAEEPVGNLFGEHIRSTQNFLEIVKDAQLQPEFLDIDHWQPAAQEKPALLYAPFLAAVSDKQLKDLMVWVKNGGTLVCDVGFALYDENGVPREDFSLLETFLGVAGYPGELVPRRTQIRLANESRDSLGFGRLNHPVSLARATALASAEGGEIPAWIQNRQGLGQVIFLNFIPEVTDRMLAFFQDQVFHSLPRMARVENRDATLSEGYEVFPFREENGTLVGVLRDMTPVKKGVRSAWFQGPIYRKGTETPAAQRVVFDRKYHIYEALAGRYEGESQEVDATFASGEGRLYALLPYRIEGLELSAAAQLAPGEQLDLQLQMKLSQPARMAPQVVTVEIVAPDGKAMPAYRQKILLREPSTSIRIPTALDEAPGQYLARARDAISGSTAEIPFTIIKP